jgi:hypothetical protein
MLRNFANMKVRYDPYHLQGLTVEAVPGCGHIEVAVVGIAAQHLRCTKIRDVLVTPGDCMCR